MNFSNPILVKEMRTRMRGRRAFFVLTGYVMTLSLILGLVYLALTNSAPQSVVNRAGEILTPVLIFVQMGLICLIAPTFSASAISSEREQETFDLLVVSLARPATIVFGKVGASLSYLLLTLFGSLPLVALTWSLGGVALDDIAIAYLVMLVAGVTYCSMSFMWSCLIRRGVFAQLLSIFTVIFLVAAMPAIALFFTVLASNFAGGPSQTFLNVVYLLLRTNPFAAIAYALFNFPSPGGVWMQSIPIWVTQVVFYLLLTGISIFFSLRRLDRVRNWI
jgi:ABC-type transport system involved in multi-copper enzyme maturation permease subunit